MRRALNIAFVVAAVLVNVLIARDMTVANTQAIRWAAPHTVIYGLHMALPTHMTNFPPERVPLP
jgi:hypothetical protein